MGQLQFSIAGSLARERSQRDDPARAAKALTITLIAALFLLPSTPVATVALSVSRTDVDFGPMAAGGTQEQVISVSATGIGAAGAIATTLTGNGFALIGSDCGELAQDESCSVRVRFSPTAASTSYGGRIDVRSENAGSATVTLRGATGDRVSTVVSASPSPLDFEAVDAGEMPEKQITISAKGDAPAGRIKTTLTGNAFALDDAGCRKELTENDSCTVTVRFEPSEAAASYKGQLSIRSARAATVNVALRGASRPKPVGPVKLGIVPKPGQFSPQPVGTTSGDYQLTVTNRSSRKIVLAYGDEFRSGPFRIAGLCSGTTLEPQKSCGESARFAPTTTGDFSGSRDILVDGIVVDSYQLSGQGIAAELSVPDTVVFEGAATSQAVSISNTGSADLIITQTAIRASRNSSFQRPPADCIRHIPPGATCDVTVTIRRGPRQAVQEGLLVIQDNAAGSPHQVSLRAETYASDLATDRSSIDFGRRTETPIAIRIVNRGNAPTGRMSFYFSESAFTLAKNSCGARIESLVSCDIAVRFSPTRAGDITGSLSVSAENGGSVQIELHGAGPAPEPVIR